MEYYVLRIFSNTLFDKYELSVTYQNGGDRQIEQGIEEPTINSVYRWTLGTLTQIARCKESIYKNDIPWKLEVMNKAISKSEAKLLEEILDLHNAHRKTNVSLKEPPCLSRPNHDRGL